LGCGGAVWPRWRNARGTAERNRAAALGFWVAAVAVWCEREGHRAKIKREGPVIRACVRSGMLRRSRP
jgi:hypothetical protein